jgi:hypothetical protein
MGATDADAGGDETDSLHGIQWVGIVAALASGAIHLLLGIRMAPAMLGISFILAGGGFLGGVALIVRGYRRRTVYMVGIPFTLLQIVLWYVINFATGPKSFPGDIGALGGIDKVAQLVLIGVLVVLLRN